MATISEALTIALQHHQAGRLDAAEEIYQRILQVEPDQPDALHFLGVLTAQRGRPEAAAAYIARAIVAKPNVAPYHLNLGLAYQASRKPNEAIACYQRALQLQPEFVEVHYNLGNAWNEQGQLAEAVACYRRAIELRPNYAEGHYNLGKVLQDQGNLDEAIACYRRAIELKPDYAEAHNNLGTAFKDQGKLDETVACCRRAVELNPDYAEAYNNLGTAFTIQEKLDEAVACYRRALELKPDNAEAHFNLGKARQNQGKLEEAVASYCRAIELKPDYTMAHFNLGKVFHDQGNVGEAVACYQRSVQLKPDFAEAHYNLGNSFLGRRELDEAAACYRRALESKADFAEAHFNLGNVLMDQAELDEAIACYRRAWELKPDYAMAQSNLVYALNFSPDYDAEAIYEEHRHWNQRHVEPLAPFIVPHGNDRSPQRRLRVGYVSPDFRGHPVGLFLLPLLEAHNHRDFEIFCYASQDVSDGITQRCRAAADAWRNVFDFSDEQLADAIRQDRIDILVDLTMHMAKGRLLVFARKPAPVQVTYLAYCGTTGLRVMDYRLTDPYLDPPGDSGRCYSEQSVWLPETYWCYRPTVEAPPVDGLPAMPAGAVTFGCLNNFCKVTAPTLAAWSRLLQAVPGSRLLVHAHPGKHRDRVWDFFTKQGVSAERVTFAGKLPIMDYFRAYERIDVALDPFPYGGGTTTCDALWMGVPVVSLAGQTAVGRGGLSILSNLGLTDLVARDCEQYVRIAADLANDLPRLGQLRATLRERMQNSPLMDAPRFAGNIEAAYRAMWQRWCEGDGGREADAGDGPADRVIEVTDR